MRSKTTNTFLPAVRARAARMVLDHVAGHPSRWAAITSIAAANGATEHQLMAIFGWESPKQAARWAKTANRKRLAGDAMHPVVPAKG